VSAVTVNVHDPVPVQTAPLQPANEDPDPGVAVRVMDVPVFTAAEQVPPQLMPAGELEMTPEPVPLVATETVACGGGAAAKLAFTDLSESRLTLQPPVPEQAPLQPVKDIPFAGETTSATIVPLMKLVLQVAPQLIPAGLLEMVPPLDGVAATVSLYGTVAGLGGVLVAVLLLVLPLSTRVGVVPPLPPQPVRRNATSTASAVLRIARHPPTRITNSSYRAQKCPAES
jgi:hypothetical protein